MTLFRDERWPALSEVASWQNSMMVRSMLVDQGEVNDRDVIGEYQLGNTSGRWTRC